QRFGGTLRGRVVLTAGLGGMGGAQPLAVTMNEGVALVVEVDQARIERRQKTRYLDRVTADLDEALSWVETARGDGQPLSVGLVGNAADVHVELVRRGFRPDVVTDQTSAHDPLNGYLPVDLSLEEAAELRQRSPEDYVRQAYRSMADQVGAMLALKEAGAGGFGYGNKLPQGAREGGRGGAFDYPRVVPSFLRPTFFRGRRAVSWGA